MSEEFIIGHFDDEEKLAKAGHKVKDEKFTIHDFYTPFPVHGLDELLDIKRSRLPYVTFVAGGIGLVLSMTFQVWTSAFDWPINVGGKPMQSIPAFIPVTFELMVLFGALTTVAAFFYRSKLFPGREVIILDHRQLDDHFLLVVKKEAQSEKLMRLLESEGAFKVESKSVEVCNEN